MTEEAQLKFELAAEDRLSGVATSQLLLDGQPVAEGQTLSAAALDAGPHVVKYIVSDVAGNIAEKSYTFQITGGAVLATDKPGQAVLSSNSGHSSGRASGEYEYRAELVNAAGETVSDIIKVTVSK
ncbi:MULTISPECIES: hypothetical protein [unclassified Paenibacillus]|uniref:hypothetical protein n=1 Tax=unclassified Paenibacillus TaxID=185978 RepID=UPI002405B8E0|nr:MULTISPECIES: hypothetical protein [unclassified Paenibacillus]MDF9842608.1 hypothetical protein [Paenibacillus sp. PastF-2]MDF9849185.1 hypothetical protein [Paenibacillus sp. PastM-2]MDF9855769.1 hypothetical protein [Paenibacillus sp. PastF-1]MDH6481027.1 hypothetical protein [Paenibacillus sp. PastH-2]MDH6508460.1 hypothetical protein [Paenibacillus sp. PastM-3]